MYAQLCSSRCSIFTVVVVYSRTNTSKKSKTNKRGCGALLLMFWIMREATILREKKKNGAHTHVRTTVQLEMFNIHGGCCLFSHMKNKISINTKCGIVIAF